MTFSKIITLVIGISLGAALLAVVADIVISLLVVGVFALTMLIRRDWVPVIYNIRSLTVRGTTTAVSALRLALVVFVFATVMMPAIGVKKTLAATGSEGVAKVIRKGSQN